MELSTAVKLIKPGITSTHPSAWADLGAGTGLFTRALGTLLPSGSTIYTVDSNKSALEKIKPIKEIELVRIHADFETLPEAKIEREPTLSKVEGAREKIERPSDPAHAGAESRDLPLSALDGILMANSLHFVQDKISFIKKASTWLKPDGCFVIVEYNTDKRNAWVPYPISFESTKELFSSLGYNVELIGEEKSVYNKAGIYSAALKR